MHRSGLPIPPYQRVPATTHAGGHRGAALRQARLYPLPFGCSTRANFYLRFIAVTRHPPRLASVLALHSFSSRDLPQITKSNLR